MVREKVDLKTEILEYLIKKYEEATGKKMVCDSDMKSTEARYYFKTLDDNLVEPMGEKALEKYGEGDGNELKEKMRAIRSSSAMTFNLLGNGKTTIKNNLYLPTGSYDVTFEKQLRTIRNSKRKANLDAFLETDEVLIFCEMKMTEWLFNKPGTVSKNYFDSGHYRDEESAEAFISVAKAITSNRTTDYDARYSGLKQYDGVQMFKHMLGVYNHVFHNEKFNARPETVFLVNCVWELESEAFLSEGARKEYLKKLALEHDEFEKFYQATKPVRDLFKEKGVIFDIRYITFSEMLDILEKSEKERKWLERY